MAAMNAAKVVSLDAYRRQRAKERLAAVGIAMPGPIDSRFPTERIEAMVDTVTRYQRQFDRYWAPAPGSNG